MIWPGTASGPDWPKGVLSGGGGTRGARGEVARMPCCGCGELGSERFAIDSGLVSAKGEPGAPPLGARACARRNAPAEIFPPELGSVGDEGADVRANGGAGESRGGTGYSRGVMNGVSADEVGERFGRGRLIEGGGGSGARERAGDDSEGDDDLIGLVGLLVGEVGVFGWLVSRCGVFCGGGGGTLSCVGVAFKS